MAGCGGGGGGGKPKGAIAKRGKPFAKSPSGTIRPVKTARGVKRRAK